MNDELKIRLEAYPTIAEARRMIGLGRTAMKRYVTTVMSDNLIHPSEVMSIADQAWRNGQFKRSFNEVAASLIEFSRTASPESVDGVIQVVDEFFSTRSSTMER